MVSRDVLAPFVALSDHGELSLTAAWGERRAEPIHLGPATTADLSGLARREHRGDPSTWIDRDVFDHADPADIAQS